MFNDLRQSPWLNSRKKEALFTGLLMQVNLSRSANLSQIGAKALDAVARLLKIAVLGGVGNAEGRAEAEG